MTSDWALLQIDEAISGAALLATADEPPADQLRMAGYPRSATTAATNGKAVTGELDDTPTQLRMLEVSPPCRILGSLGRDPRSDCVLRKGASGGAVFSLDPRARYLGVISQGDQQSQSIFVPVARFRNRITPYLRAQVQR